jgi:hypothetical protein
MTSVELSKIVQEVLVVRRSSIRLRLFFPALLLLLPTALPAVTDPAYTELRNARPDGRTVPVSGLVLERDVFKFQFDSGTLHFLKPVGGRTVGAVFVGHGSYRLSPATENERRQLALSSNADKGFETLTDQFDDLVLLFADDTAQEIELHAPVRTGAPDSRATDIYERYLKRQRKDFKINFHVRLLKDLLNSPGLMSGVFMALVEGKKVPPALAAVDPDGAEALGFYGRLGEEDTIFFVADANRGGLWYQCDRQAEVDRKRKSPEKRLTDALDYTIRQEGVSKDFRALVPIYVEFGKNETARVGMIPLAGETTVPVDVKLKLPKRARKAMINVHGEVLARD